MLLPVAAVLKICGVKVAPFLRGNMRKPAASDASVGASVKLKILHQRCVTYPPGN